MVLQAFTVPGHCFYLLFFQCNSQRNRKAVDAGGGLVLAVCPAPLVQPQCQPVLGVVVGSHSSASLAAKITGAFSSLHKLSANAVGAEVKRDQVQSEVRTGTVLFSGNVAWVYLSCLCTCISRDSEQPAKARGGEVTG